MEGEEEELIACIKVITSTLASTFINDHLCGPALSVLVTMVSGIKKDYCLSLGGWTLDGSNELLECGCQATDKDSRDEYARKCLPGINSLHSPKIDFFHSVQFNFINIAFAAIKIVSRHFTERIVEQERGPFVIHVNSWIYWRCRTKTEQPEISGVSGTSSEIINMASCL